MSRASTGRMVEWITNLAVVASLAVLVVEVRANTTAIERDMLQERSAKIATNRCSPTGAWGRSAGER